MRMLLLLLLVGFQALPCMAAEGNSVAGPSKCSPIEEERFWLPDDQASAMPLFLDKARRINDTGTCVVDGWFGKNAHKFYMTIVPPGSSRIGRVVSFTHEELTQ